MNVIETQLLERFVRAHEDIAGAMSALATALAGIRHELNPGEFEWREAGPSFAGQLLDALTRKAKR